MPMFITLIFFVAAADQVHSALTEIEKKIILDEHNKVRSNVVPTASDMLQLKWNDELANTAQKHADNCIAEHNVDRSSDSPSFRYVGENVYISSHSDGITKKSVEEWASEKSNYNYQLNSCVGACGHYTQVVWAKTQYLGCGYKRCKGFVNLSLDGYIFVCNYAEGGNYHGEKPYKSGSSCSQCPSGFICEDNLCIEQQLSSFQQNILDEHNDVRSKVIPNASNMKKLKWSHELATTAKNYAGKCKWVYNAKRSDQSPSFKAVGENLYASSSALASNTIKAVDFWIRDPTFANSTESCRYACRTYRQVVWANTEYLGCYINHCSTFTVQNKRYRNRSLLVCNYGEMGNFRHSTPYMQGVACSGCSSGSTCANNLCKV